MHQRPKTLPVKDVHIEARRSKAMELLAVVQAGLMSTMEFAKQVPGFHIRVGGKRSYSKYTNQNLRDIRAKQTREALDRHYALGGEPVDESRCIDLHM